MVKSLEEGQPIYVKPEANRGNLFHHSIFEATMDDVELIRLLEPTVRLQVEVVLQGP